MNEQRENCFEKSKKSVFLTMAVLSRTHVASAVFEYSTSFFFLSFFGLVQQERNYYRYLLHKSLLRNHKKRVESIFLCSLSLSFTHNMLDFSSSKT